MSYIVDDKADQTCNVDEKCGSVALQAQSFGTGLGLQAACDEARSPAYIHISDYTPCYTLCYTGDCVWIPYRVGFIQQLSHLFCNEALVNYSTNTSTG